jgi:hypothetical protein
LSARTFNPWIGCTRVSAGCEHCYETIQLTHGERVFLIDKLEASLYLLRCGPASQRAGTLGKKPPARETATPLPLQKFRYSREEAAVLLPFSRRSLDYAIEHGRITVTREATRVFILHSELIRYSKTDHPSSVRNGPDEVA